MAPVRFLPLMRHCVRGRYRVSGGTELIKQLSLMNACNFRGRYGVSGATVRVPSLLTRVGFQVEDASSFFGI